MGEICSGECSSHSAWRGSEVVPFKLNGTVRGFRFLQRGCKTYPFFWDMTLRYWVPEIWGQRSGLIFKGRFVLEQLKLFDPLRPHHHAVSKHREPITQ